MIIFNTLQIIFQIKYLFEILPFSLKYNPLTFSLKDLFIIVYVLKITLLYAINKFIINLVVNILVVADIY